MAITTIIPNIPTLVRKGYGGPVIRTIYLDVEISPNPSVKKYIDIHFVIPDQYRESFVSLFFHTTSSTADRPQTSCSDRVPIDPAEHGALDQRLGQTILYVKY